MICKDPAARGSILPSIPGAQVIDPTSASLLGSPIGDTGSTSDAISRKTQLLRTMGERLQYVSAHDALLLLRNSFAIPKLLYLLRSSPSFLSPKLKDYDDVLRSIVGSVANTRLDDNAWSQASLPVKAGGLGIRSAVQIAPSAFLSSAAASSDLVHLILPPRFGSQEVLHVGSALTSWSLDQDHPPPVAPASHHQKVWDTIKVSAKATALLENAPRCTVTCPPLGRFSQRIRRLAECLADLLSWFEDGRQHHKGICGTPSWYHPLSSSCLPSLRGGGEPPGHAWPQLCSE